MSKEFSRQSPNVEGIPNWDQINDHLIAEHNKIWVHGSDDHIRELHIDKGHAGNLKHVGGDEDTHHVHTNEVVHERVHPQPWKLRFPKWSKENPQ
jgi:hypothetical protein